MASHEEATGLIPDFRVSYSVFSAEDGGRKTPFYQGIRWDFAYEDKSIGKAKQVFIIWPEFVSATGEVLPEGTLPHKILPSVFTASEGTFEAPDFSPSSD